MSYPPYQYTAPRRASQQLSPAVVVVLVLGGFGLLLAILVGGTFVVAGAVAWLAVKEAAESDTRRAAQISQEREAAKQRITRLQREHEQQQQAEEELKRRLQSTREGADDLMHPDATNYLAKGGAATVLRAFKEHLKTSTIDARELSIHADSARLEARDPRARSHFDVYHLNRKGVVSKREPIPNSRLRNLDQVRFDPDQVALDKIPELIVRTERKLDYEQGKAGYVVIRSGRPFSRQIVMRIYVRGPRDSGSISYRADGRELSVHR